MDRENEKRRQIKYLSLMWKKNSTWDISIRKISFKKLDFWFFLSKKSSGIKIYFKKIEKYNRKNM